MNATFSLNARPTCPTILIPYEKNLYALPIHQMDIRAEFNVSTAFVKVVGIWKNIANYTSDCMFVLPVMGTVTNVHIEVNSRFFETMVISKEEAQELKKTATKEEKKPKEKATGKEADGALPEGLGFEEYIPNLFRLPIQGVGPGDMIRLTCVYIEPLEFREGKYHFHMPMKFGANLLPKKKSFDDVITFKCVVNSVTTSNQVECTSHDIKELQGRGRRQVIVSGFAKDVVAKEGQPAPAGPPAKTSVDIHIAYSLSSDEILPTLIYEEETTDNGAEGTFLLFVTPPSLDKMKSSFSRSVVFMLDRSGSMYGEPYSEACRALTAALGTLGPKDKFTIVSFDHRQEFFKQELVVATPANVEQASTWVRMMPPERGGTDIMAPLQWGLKTLEAMGDGSLPFVVLLTDGCVNNEREICKMASGQCGNARVLTLGIGSYCNWFFLKMLAQIGRGFSDVVVYKEKIFNQMLQLLNMAAVPIITNIDLDIEGLDEVEIYPFPIPDLFMGAPLTISGRYRGQFPNIASLRGLLADDANFQMAVSARTSEVIPVSKVFIKQRLDLLTARAWLEQSKEVEKQVVDLSVETSMTSAYTTMVAFQATEQQRKEFAEGDEDLSLLGELDEEGRGGKDGASSSSDQGPKEKPKKKKVDKAAKKQWYKNKKTVAALAAGGLVVIGAAAFSFGDLAATAGNASVLGSMGGFDIGGCADCGGCGDCSNCDCGSCASC